MSNWKHTLDFSYFYHNDEVATSRKGELIEKEIQKVLKKYLNYEDAYRFDTNLADIADMFLCTTGWEMRTLGMSLG